MRPPQPLSRIAAFAAVLTVGVSAHAGDFFFKPFTGDGDSQIDPLVDYTVNADINGSGARFVNGILFGETGSTGANYTLGGTTGTFNNNGNNLTGATNGLDSDFVYGGTGTHTLTLTNLVVGQSYVTTWYNVGFGPVNGRNVTITANDTNTTTIFDENFSGDKNGNLLQYAFVAKSNSITYTFDAVNDSDSFHHYAFSNAVQSKIFSTPKITAVTGTASFGTPFTPFAVRGDDLLQTRLANVTSSDPNAFTHEGALGIPVLTDGQFAIQRNAEDLADHSALATVENGAYIQFNLDTSVNTRGYDISRIATYGGWNDSGRDNQKFLLSISYVGSDAFVDFGSIFFDPSAGGDPSAISAIFDTALTGIDAIRIDFLSGQENGYAGLGEVDVIGTATIPEPTSAAMLFMGAGLLVFRRKRIVRT